MNRRALGSFVALVSLTVVATPRAQATPAQPRAIAGLALVSATSTGAASGGVDAANAPSVSADGRYVAFATSAPIAPVDTGSGIDAYVRDVTGSATTLASGTYPGVAPAGATVRNPQVSSSGREVLWGSDQNAWVDDATAPAAQLYLADRAAATVSRISRSQSGQPVVGSDVFDLSTDGRFVLFASAAGSFGPVDGNGLADLYRLDRIEGTVERISTALGGGESNGPVTDADGSADGRYIVFASTASNLVAGDSGTSPDLFRYDLVDQTTTRLTDGSATSSARIDAKGDVCFTTSAPSLIPGGGNGSPQVVFQSAGGARTIVSQTSSHAAGTGASANCTITADGQYVAFESAAADLVSGDANGTTDIFMTDLASTITSRLVEDSGHPAISATGKVLAFTSTAKLVAADTNATADVYRLTVPFSTGHPLAVLDELRSDQLTFGSEAPNLVANDVDPSALYPSIVQQPVDGTVTLDGDRHPHYDPPESPWERRAFTYTANNSLDGSPSTAVIIHRNQPDIAAPCCGSLDVFRRSGKPRAIIVDGIAGVRPARLRAQVWTMTGTGPVVSVELDTDDGQLDLALPGPTTDRVYRLRIGEVTADGVAWGEWEGEQVSGYRSAGAVPLYSYVEAGISNEFENAFVPQWVANMRAGTPPSALVNGMLSRSKWNKKLPPVTRLFRAYFLRLPDTGGLDYWSNKFEKGTRLNAISQSFATSSEFKNRYGSLSNAKFVDLVYQNVLGRLGDAGGRSYWTGKLNKGTSRGEVMVGFSESSEYKTKTKGVTQAVLAYRALLGRAPKSTDTTYAAEMQNGAPLTLVVSAILGTEVYEDRLP